jgi:5-oxoprolinase (ATP-hydrolysing) subunit A
MSHVGPAIDLNADLGEGYPWDGVLLAQVSSASVCCGAHASDPETIRHTLRAAKARGVVVGAHPGFPDREGFGRREREVSAAEVESLIRDQVSALSGLAAGDGVPIRFLKPHGALYNQAQRDDAIASGVLSAAATLGLPVLGQPGSRLEARARDAGVGFIGEGFADRRYRPDGRLVPRTEPGAVLDDPDEIASQVLRLVEQGVATLCLHGDNPHSVRLADLILATLDRAGVAVRSFL